MTEIESLELKIKELSNLRPWVSLAALILDWFIVVGVIFFITEEFLFLGYVLAVIIIASRQQAIGVISHDVVHFRFLKNRFIGDTFGNIFMTWPLFFTIPGYRSMHLRHHSKVNTHDDPDWVRRKGKSDWLYPMSKGKLYKMLFLDISGFNLYQNIEKVFLPKSDTKLKDDFKNTSPLYYLSMFVFYAFSFGLIYKMNGIKIFLLYWIVPYFTFFKLIKRLRAVGEHFGIPVSSIDEITRTTIANPVEEFLFAQHNINYHIEHHRWAGVPWYNLPKLHKILTEKNLLEKMGHVTPNGYVFGLLNEVTQDCALNKLS